MTPTPTAPDRPFRLGDFEAEAQGRTLVQNEYEWADSNGRKTWGSGHHVLELPGHVVQQKLYPDLLAGLTYGGCGEIRVFRFLSATGQGHMARPRVSCTISSADEENGVGLRSENYGYGSPEEGWVVIGILARRAEETLPQAKSPNAHVMPVSRSLVSHRRRARSSSRTTVSILRFCSILARYWTPR